MVAHHIKQKVQTIDQLLPNAAVAQVYSGDHE
jgi:hypothetical protein